MNAIRKRVLNFSEHTAEDAIVDSAIASGMISDEELAAAEELEGLAASDEEEYRYTPDDDEEDEDYDSDEGSDFFHDVEDEDDDPDYAEYPIESEDINDSIALQGVDNPFMYEAARLNEKLHAITEEAQLTEEE